MVRELDWEDYPYAVDGMFVLVIADGDSFRNDTEPSIAIFLLVGKMFGPCEEEKG